MFFSLIRVVTTSLDRAVHPHPHSPCLWLAWFQAISKSQNDADTLVNLICCCRHLDKPASFVDRYINQLKTSHPQHPYVQALANAETAFDRVAATFAVA